MEEGLVTGARSLRLRLILILTIITAAKMYRTLITLEHWPKHLIQNPSFHPHSRALRVDHPKLNFAYEEIQRS